MGRLGLLLRLLKKLPVLPTPEPTPFFGVCFMVTFSGHLSLSLGQGSVEQGPGVLRALGNRVVVGT